MANFDGKAAGAENIRQLWNLLASLVKKLTGDVDLTKGDLQTQVTDLKKSVSDGKTSVANAITGKGVTTATDATFATMAANVAKINTLSGGTADATAAAAEILTGKTAYVKGAKVTGTMANQGAKTASLNCGGSYTIPAGYHNGSGKVTANSLASQTSATAEAAEILSGETAYVNGAKVTGTMANQGAKTASLNCGGSYTIPKGYHNGNGKVTAGTVISIYAMDFIGETVTLSGAEAQTSTVDENGFCNFKIKTTGNYAVSCGDQSVSVTVDALGKVYAVTIEIYVPDGATITPVNDVSVWLSCAAITNKNYTTLSQVISDTTTLYLLMSDENAMKYLTRSTGFADTGCANETFMTYLGQSPYVDDTVLNSDLWVSAIKQSPYKNKVLLPQAELVVGNTYKFGGYNWIVAEKSDVSGYAVLQSTGLTGGTWPGYAMSGTLTNAAGSTITLTGANTYYTGNIDGYDISNYNSTTQSLYNSIKAAEYTSATYGKGLYLVSNSKAGTTSAVYQGSGYYWSALKSAATNYSSFGINGDCAWLGTVNGSYYAWYVYQKGNVYNGINQDVSYVVAPAFNLDTCLIKVSGDEIVLL